jgi:DNA-binding MarR family transcriptional regulator
VRPPREGVAARRRDRRHRAACCTNRAGATSGSTTTLLDRLERAGYITRSPDPRDRRKIVVRPTPLALRRTHEVYGPIAAEGAQALERFTPAELGVVLRYLQISRELQQRHLQRLRP